MPQAAAATAREGELPEILPRELAERLKLGTVDLIDVREPHEWEIARIDGARLIPLSTIAGHLHELDSARDIVVQCKGGVRSAKALRTLQAAGFTRVWNLVGGITRWSDDVDPTIPKY